MLGESESFKNSLNFSSFKIFLPFFLSGLTGLSYQLLWQKKLLLLLGAVSYSVVAVFLSFILGFAIGAKIADRLLQKNNSSTNYSLKLYLFFELCILCWAILFQMIYPTVDAIYSNLPFLELGEFYLRLSIAVILLLPATMAMGTTLPLMIDHLKKNLSNYRATYLAYGINTLGAVLGVLLTAFIFLPQLGILKTLITIMGINLLLVVFTYFVFKEKNNELLIEKTPTENMNSLKSNYILTSYFLFGAVSLGLEIVWLRILSLYTSSGHFMFAVFMAVYLLAFALGSLVLFPYVQAKVLQTSRFSIFVGIFFLGMLLGDYWLETSPYVSQHLIQKSLIENSVVQWKIMVLEIYPILCLIFLPSLSLGALFPYYVSHSRATSGNLYAIGCLGGCIGIVLTSLLLIPQIGLRRTLVFWMVVALIAFLLTQKDKKLLQQKLTRGSIVVFLLIISILFWKLNIYTKFPFGKRRDAENVLAEYQNQKLVSHIVGHKTGEISSVIVRKENNSENILRLYVDEQSVASTLLREVVDAKMLAHLPILLHPLDPKNMDFLSVGFGSGGTSKSLSTYPVRADIVEIEKKVLEVAKIFPYWRDIDFSNIKPIINDARDYLKRTKKDYDIIVTDVTNLQYKQNPSLYTVEYFFLIQKKLKAEGIAAAWIPLASITENELKILIASFMKVFPHTSMWHMNHVPTTFAILMGTEQKFLWNDEILNRIKTKFSNAQVKHDLENIYIKDPSQIENFFFLNENQLSKFVSGTPLHTDDNSLLEYQSSFSFYRYHQLLQNNLNRLKSL